MFPKVCKILERMLDLESEDPNSRLRYAPVCQQARGPLGSHFAFLL